MFELAGLLTHVGVLGIGFGGLFGLLPLPRGRRSGLGLILMALAMGVLVLWPRWRPGPDVVAAAAHVTLFAVALWLLVGPAPTAR